MWLLSSYVSLLHISFWSVGIILIFKVTLGILKFENGEVGSGQGWITPLGGCGRRLSVVGSAPK